MKDLSEMSEDELTEYWRNDPIVKAALALKEPPRPYRSNDPEHFWRGVRKSRGDKCWHWKRGTDSNGYGRIGWHGRVEGAHRVAYELTYGHPGNLFVCHHCDNPICCRPEHLFLGTAADNMRDMVAKGRHGRMRKNKCG